MEFAMCNDCGVLVGEEVKPTPRSLGGGGRRRLFSSAVEGRGCKALAETNGSIVTYLTHVHAE